MALIVSPMIVPLVIVAVGVYFFYAPLGLTGSLLGLTLAHTALAVPFVVITVGATLQGFDHNQARAGASLGASPSVVFFRIILPLILPGVISGALFAFVTSFDEVVVALFVTGPAERTLPRQMFNGIRENISPVIAAAATLRHPPLGAAPDRARAAPPPQRAPARDQDLISTPAGPRA